VESRSLWQLTDWPGFRTTGANRGYRVQIALNRVGIERRDECGQAMPVQFDTGLQETLGRT
jgi:hypothetical protein